MNKSPRESRILYVCALFCILGAIASLFGEHALGPLLGVGCLAVACWMMRLALVLTASPAKKKDLGRYLDQEPTLHILKLWPRAEKDRRDDG